VKAQSAAADHRYSFVPNLARLRFPGSPTSGHAREEAPSRKLVLMIGTVKGVFLYATDEGREKWKLTGPHLGGWEIFSLCGDSRNGRILAGTVSFEHGSTIRTSKDFGKTWVGVKRDPKFEKGSKAELKHIWQIVPGTRRSRARGMPGWTMRRSS